MEQKLPFVEERNHVRVLRELDEEEVKILRNRSVGLSEFASLTHLVPQ